MDIKIPHSALTQFLKTSAAPEKIAKSLSLCGPTVDKLEKISDDWIYHIEVITNRVDTASAYGIAREAHAILPEFEYKTEIINDPFKETTTSLGVLPSHDPVKVVIKDKSLVRRFTCISLTNITIKPSPQQTQSWLNLTDQRPIDNVVDISNELTLLYGQPVHGCGLDLIKRATMIVRESRQGEKLITLDGRTHNLKGGDIVIEDGQGRLIDLCGIMGGGLSAVNSNTKNILLFVQTYDPKRIRRTSLYTGERTLAAQLFEKQPDPEMVLPTLIAGARMLMQRANAKPTSKILDIYPSPYKPKGISFEPNWVKSFAGVNLPDDKIVSILSRLHFSPQIDSDQIVCTIPSHRQHDINIKEDIAEEVMRVYGYFRLPSEIPPTTLIHSTTDPLLRHETTARIFLSHTGFTEMYNHALIGKTLAQKSGITLKNTFNLTNPLSDEYTSMRQLLLPSLLENLSFNRGLTSPPHRLFELANTYTSNSSHQNPLEVSTLGLVGQSLEYDQFKGHLESLFKHLKLTVTFSPTKATPTLFDPRATAQLFVGSTPIGFLGRINAIVLENFKLEGPVFGSEINFSLLSQNVIGVHHFDPIPVNPPVIEDLTFTLPVKTYIGPFIQTILSAHEHISSVVLKTQYQQNYTLTIIYRDPNVISSTNLTDETVAPIRKKIVNTAQTQFNAQLVGQI